VLSPKRERCGGVGIRSGRIRCSGLGHRTEGDRIARGLDRRDAVLPEMAGGAGHHVERAWLRVERETFPLVAGLTAETEFAGRGGGGLEYLIEVLFFAGPADAGADIVLRAEPKARRPSVQLVRPAAPARPAAPRPLPAVDA